VAQPATVIATKASKEHFVIFIDFPLIPQSFEIGQCLRKQLPNM
jgi:hypothetical protein